MLGTGGRITAVCAGLTALPPTCVPMIADLSITKPTLILDKARALGNIDRMVRKARKAGVFFRPHFKTHQSAVIGGWFREAGVRAIAVSSVSMARYFARNGWWDITIAFPLNLLELDEIASLAESVALGVLVDSDAAVAVLQSRRIGNVGVWIKIDAGYGRAGLPWNQIDLIVSLARLIQDSKKLSLKGILAHNGHTYRVHSADGVKHVHFEAMSRLQSVKDTVLAGGVEACAISIGDTPSCSVLESFEGADEIRPGNFVFYDIMQTAIGSCTEHDIAVAVACPVVGKYPDRRQILIYGGAVHFSKEHLLDDAGKPIYGYLLTESGDSLGEVIWSAPVVALSQEHGIVHIPGELFDGINIGDVILVAPVHSCLTCNLFPEYVTTVGERVAKTSTVFPLETA